MKTKLFVFACFYTLCIFLVAIMPFNAAETKKSNINIEVHGYENWLSRGTILQGGDRNTNEFDLGAIWNGNKGENNDGCGDGIEGHCGKGYIDVTWQKDHTWGRGWWASGGKGGGGGKGGKGGKGGGGGYKIPIPGGGKGDGGKVGDN
ncbi:hypothetical protein MtrunA17_Chr5g0438361 [Medicago truncatula]|uniref:Nodule-specific Glycine Rich Peptide MtNodGRP1C n=1 Tax=Medicago truncatula TaxID=3880 RepID=A0A072UFV5_MEDTR|nr:glycine-rich cell wall structural protein 1 isoform X1 [Medicago truncatula]KEH28301.1 Nodule-specific Glycine Rich Peptide MtNodGRP1C [Medicago truncatula]RHN57250.1 hypothetical protein MtrunA17_Chr5g0438361 [Medicago truncatula]